MVRDQRHFYLPKIVQMLPLLSTFFHSLWYIEAKKTEKKHVRRNSKRKKKCAHWSLSLSAFNFIHVVAVVANPNMFVRINISKYKCYCLLSTITIRAHSEHMQNNHVNWYKSNYWYCLIFASKLMIISGPGAVQSRDVSIEFCTIFAFLPPCIHALCRSKWKMRRADVRRGNNQIKL